MTDIEKIEAEGELLAIVVRNSFKSKNLDFVTNLDHSFQVGVHNKKKGERNRAHVSKPFENVKNFNPNKIYYVKKGKVGIDVYNKGDKKVNYVTLNEGDLMIFISGGHGVDYLDNTEMFEVKQGPYRGTEQDKRFLE